MTRHSTIHPVDRHVGLQVRRLRWARGLSQAALASALGVSFQQVQKYETGANRISASILAAIADRLDTPVAAFFEGRPGSGVKSAEFAEDLLQLPEAAALMAEFMRLSPELRRRVLGIMQRLGACSNRRSVRPGRLVVG